MPLSDDSAWFWFDDSRYLDQLVRVLDGCGINDFFWVFFTEISDYGQTLTITDNVTAQQITYNTPAFVNSSMADVSALPCTTKSSSSAVSRPGESSHASLLLVNGRFSIEVGWEDFAGSTGQAQPLALTSHSGLCWLFNNSNFEIAAKIVDAGDGFFWIAFGGFTNLAVTIDVTDRCEGTSKSYFNPLATLLSPVIDKTGFPATPACLMVIFKDGFESSDSQSTPLRNRK